MRLNRCYYYLTYRCNSRCRYCDIWNVNRMRGAESGLDEIAVNLRALKNLGVRYVDFTGGEVFLRDDLPQIIATAKRMGFPTIITTNGLAYGRHAGALLGIADFINFSIDTLDAAEYKARRGVDGLSKALRAVEKARELGQKCGVIATIDADNAGGLDNLVSFCRTAGIKLSLNPIFSYNDVGGALGRCVLERLYDLAGEEDVYVNTAQIELIMSGGNSVARPMCRAMSANVVISPDDYLLLPCFHHQIEKIKIDGSLEEILAGGRVSSLRAKEGTFPFCEGCTINCYMGTARLRIAELASA
jgi:MoaA/NifB/PqqE/SkfB family radical SAM enzyme